MATADASAATAGEPGIHVVVPPDELVGEARFALHKIDVSRRMTRWLLPGAGATPVQRVAGALQSPLNHAVGSCQRVCRGGAHRHDQDNGMQETLLMIIRYDDIELAQQVEGV